MLHISYLVVIMYHDTQKLNKAAKKLDVIFLHLLSMVDLFTYCYFNMEVIIGICIL